MKKALIFTALKIAELSGVCVVFWWFSFFGGFFEPEWGFWMRMLPGITISLIAISAICGGVFVLPEINNLCTITKSITNLNWVPRPGRPSRGLSFRGSVQ